MLKFLRKYQLIILVVGGTLLMLVFLLEPILGRLTPGPEKQRVGTLGPSGERVTLLDQMMASASLNVVQRASPLLVSQLGLEPGREAEHWMLLVREARQNGLVGDAQDGEGWIPDLATQEVRTALELQARQVGLDVNTLLMVRPGLAEEATQLRQAREAQIRRALAEAAGSNVFRRDADAPARALAEARGVERLMALYRRAPRADAAEALATARRELDGVAVDTLIIPAEAVASAVPDPTDADLEAFFAERRERRAQDDELGIGYVLPARVKLEYLTLDPSQFEQGITVDRVEVNKRWRENRTAYPGEFAEESARVEAELKRELAQRAMDEADRAIRALVVRATSGVAKTREGYLDLPADFEARRPTVDQMADAIVQTVSAQLGHAVPRPETRTVADRWLTGRDVSTLPGLLAASFRVGPQMVPAAQLPLLVREVAPNPALILQRGVPLLDPAGVDAQGRKFYVTILEARGESAAENIAEVGRTAVERDSMLAREFEILRERAAEWEAIAEAEGLEAVEAVLTSAMVGGTDAARPSRTRNVVVRRTPLRGDQQPDFRMNTPEAREAIVSGVPAGLAADGTPAVDGVAGEVITIPLPRARALALARYVARRPVTDVAFRNAASELTASAAGRAMGELREQGVGLPFSLAEVAGRLRWVPTEREAEDAAE